jgi:hypothetical protein
MSLAGALVHLAPIDERIGLPKLGHLCRKFFCECELHDLCSRNPIGQRSRLLGQHNGNTLRRLHGQSDFPDKLLGGFHSTHSLSERPNPKAHFRMTFDGYDEANNRSGIVAILVSRIRAIGIKAEQEADARPLSGFQFDGLFQPFLQGLHRVFEILDAKL